MGIRICIKMASLTRITKISSFCRNLCTRKDLLAAPTIRSYAAWNKDWKPGPFPTSEAEHEAAAKKYGLRLEDYEPYPDDGLGHGDYPPLPNAPAAVRDPYMDWDLPEYKRNYGEPLHVDADAMREDAWNPEQKWAYTLPQMFACFVAVVGGSCLLFYLSLPYPHFNPVLPKQYPADGGKHYTFEPVD